MPDAADRAEYLSQEIVTPVERIAVSGRSLSRYVRTAAEVETDFFTGTLDITSIKPEKVRPQDCELVLRTLLAMVKQLGIFDYTYNPVEEKSIQQKELLERILVQLELYRVILAAPAFNEPGNLTLQRELSAASRQCTYGVYETEDPTIIGMAQRMGTIIEQH